VSTGVGSGGGAEPVESRDPLRRLFLLGVLEWLLGMIVYFQAQALCNVHVLYNKDKYNLNVQWNQSESTQGKKYMPQHTE
jgi:hypothetical protein